jgi:hypothetical protein
MKEFLDLANKCEQARTSDRKLDYAIYKAVDPTAAESWPHWDEHQREMICPIFTGSTDIAIKLVPADFAWTLARQSNGKFWASVASLDDEDGFPVENPTANPALALCSASLRARAANSSGDRGGK